MISGFKIEDGVGRNFQKPSGLLAAYNLAKKTPFFSFPLVSNGANFSTLVDHCCGHLCRFGRA